MKILVFSRHPQLLADQLHELGYLDTLCAASWPPASFHNFAEVDLVLVDVNDSVDLGQLILIRHALPSPILLLIGVTDENELVNAYRVGVDDHLGKPVSLSMLRAKLLVWQRWMNQVRAVK